MRKRWRGLCAVWLAVLLVCGLSTTGLAAEESGSDTFLGEQGESAEGETGSATAYAQTYTVTLPTGEGYTAAFADGQSAEVAAGDSCTFTVTVEKGYLASTSFAVAANGTELTNQGAEWEPYKYTIANVSENQEVTVTGVAPGTVAWLYTGSSQISAGTTIDTGLEKEDKEILFGVSLAEQGLVERPGRLDGWTVWSCGSGGSISAKISDCAADGMVSAENYGSVETDGYMLLAPVWKTAYTLVKESVTAGGGFTVTVEGSEATEAYEGEQVTVTPQPETGYEAEKVTVTAADGSAVAVSENSFLMPGASVTVGVSFVKQRFSVTLPAGAGYTAAAADGQELSAEYGGSFTFTVTIAEGYAAESLAVTADGIALTPSSVSGNVYTYTIETITASRTVAVSGVTESTTPDEGGGDDAQTYSVTLPTGKGYTAAFADGQSAEVAAGGSCTFMVSVERGYLASTSFAVAANGITLKNQGDAWEPYTYTIEKVSENQEVTVTGVVPGTMAWLYTGISQINAGMMIDTGSDKADKEVLFGVSLSGQGLVEKPGRLNGWTVWSCSSGGGVSGKISDCTADGMISAEDYGKVEADGYLLLAPVWKTVFTLAKEAVAEGGSFTVTVEGSEATEAYEGEQVTVTPQPETGYEAEKVTVTAGGSEIEVTGNSFLMPGASVTIGVSFAKQRFPVTLPVGAGYTAAADGQEPSAEYGGSFTFTVTISEGYTAGDSFAVTADGIALTPSNVSGNVYTYTIENITAPRVVAVTGVTETAAPDGGDGGGSDTPGGTISQSGTQNLTTGTAYVLGEGTWKVSGDNTIYQGGVTFYVPENGEYVFEKQ